ncbi:MAG: VacJ family lipoprotein [Pseudomonadota bacterium]|nr:MAG: VacJ family lipoprotein [Pseudomonadota bacterium]
MIARPILIVAAALVLSSCATTSTPPEARHEADPWEPLNRSVYQFNSGADRLILRPLSRAYTTITPDPVETGLGNFFTNLRSPTTIINLLLQGRAGDAGRQFHRLFVNTVFGLGGLIDLTGRAGLEHFEEDFGQTFAVWGWSDSRYLVLPFLGPSTVRDGFGSAADLERLVIRRELFGDTTGDIVTATNILHVRATLLPLDREIEQALDPYLFVRDSYLQRRSHQISDGEQGLPDYEAFLKEGSGP